MVLLFHSVFPEGAIDIRFCFLFILNSIAKNIERYSGLMPLGPASNVLLPTDQGDISVFQFACDLTGTLDAGRNFCWLKVFLSRRGIDTSRTLAGVS